MTILLWIFRIVMVILAAIACTTILLAWGDYKHPACPLCGDNSHSRRLGIFKPPVCKIHGQIQSLSPNLKAKIYG